MSIMSEGSTEEVTSEPKFIATRNYTGPEEKQAWWYIKRWTKDWSTTIEPGINNPFKSRKQPFRQRRTYMYGYYYDFKPIGHSLRTSIGNSDEIGAFTKLTNSYFLVGGEDQASEAFCRIVTSDLPNIPVIKTSLAGCRIVGRMCVGNKYGLIVPEATYDTEIQQIKEELPESIKLQKVEERLSALGNVVVCNDSVALIHPDLDKETEEIIAKTLQVEVFRSNIGNSPLVGSYCVLNNDGGVINSDGDKACVEDLSSLLDLPLLPGTVNSGNKDVASGLIANDMLAYAGMKTTTHEFTVIEKAFHMGSYKT